MTAQTQLAALPPTEKLPEEASLRTTVKFTGRLCCRPPHYRRRNMDDALRMRSIYVAIRLGACVVTKESLFPVSAGAHLSSMVSGAIKLLIVTFDLNSTVMHAASQLMTADMWPSATTLP